MARVRAPQLPQHFPWLNSDRPLSLASLRGRVVLLDFWTYGCINCLHVLPDLKYLEQKYRDCLTVIGVHTAKFEHEQDTGPIQQAILRYQIAHPVLVDQGREVWQQYAIRAWPTLVLIDPQGYIIASWAGEGQREQLDELIGQVLQAHQEQGSLQPGHPLLQVPQPLLTPLAFPGKVLADAEHDRLFIADSGHHRIVMGTLAGEGVLTVGTGQAGWVDGPCTTAEFCMPQGMALDRQKRLLYVADTGNHCLRQIDLEQQTVTTIAGTGAQSPILWPHGGQARVVALNSPWDLAWVDDRLYIAMAGSHQIWQLELATGHLQTYAGTGAEGWADGPAAQAAFAQPSGISLWGSELIVADSETSSIRAITLREPAVVRTVCGSGELFGFGDRDGRGADARLQHCLGVTQLGDRLWVADTYNHKIKQVDPQTGDCQTVLGDGRPDDPETALAEPSGVSATPTHLYIADTNHHCIRSIDWASLTLTTLVFPGLCSPTVCLP